MIRVSVSGDNAVQLRLSRGVQKLRNLRPLLRRIGMALTISFHRNMRSGVGPNGETLPPVQRWTRLLAGKQPYAKVLHATGTLRRSIGPLSVSATRLVFGFHGNFPSIASAQTLGTPGRIRVSADWINKLGKKKGRARIGNIKAVLRNRDGEFNGTSVAISKSENVGKGYRRKGLKPDKRTERGTLGISRTGNMYIRLRTNEGRWFTRRIVGGYVSVRPRPRRFFYLGRKDIAMIRREALAYVGRL